MIQLISRWGKKIDPDNILPEYPRPKLVRDSYINLNGEWEYCIDGKESADTYDGKILVPFSPETLLSGVERIVNPHQYLHYRKSFTLPPGFIRSRVLLHFGAVDQECRVFVNGGSVGEHKGGYLPFYFDITEKLHPGENIITMDVIDRTEYSPMPGESKSLRKRANTARSSIRLRAESGKPYGWKVWRRLISGM